MKQFKFILLYIFFFSVAVYAVDPTGFRDVNVSSSVKIGGTGVADASAALELKSITKGLLLPRMTAIQRGAIVSPATGLIVFDTDFGLNMLYNGTNWQESGVPTAPFASLGKFLQSGGGFVPNAWNTPGPTSGGTGFTTWTLGATLYSDATNSLAQLAGNTTSTKKFLTQTGTGSVSAAPAWATIVGADLPNPGASSLGGTQSLAPASHNFLTGISTSGVVTQAQPAFSDISGTANLTSQVTGVLPPANGGTGVANSSNLTWTASNALTFTTTGATNVTLPTTGTVDTIAGANTLTNKILTSPGINGANFNFGTASNTNRLVLPADTTTNLAGYTNTAGLIAYDSTQNLPVYNNGTAWQNIGSGGGGSGSGTYEFFTNGNAETNTTTGWNVYAGEDPYTDGSTTVGSAHVTLTRTTTAGQFLRGTASFLFTKDAVNRKGEGTTFAIATDNVENNISVPVWFSFDYTTSANYASGDVQLFAYDVTNGKILTVLDSNNLSGALQANATNGRFTGYFMSNPGSKSYRVSWHVATTNATAYTVVLDTLHAGGANLVPGAIVTPKVAWTPTGAFTTNATYTGWKWRIGDQGYYEVLISFSGATNAATTLTVNMPSGEVIDTTKLLSTGATEEWGDIYENVSGAQNIGETRYNSSTSIVGIVRGAAGTYVNDQANITTTVPATIAASTQIRLFWHVPIVGWGIGSAVLTNDASLQTPAPLQTASSVKTPTGTGVFHALTNNSLTLTAGTWNLFGACAFSNSGSAPAYAQQYCNWFGANGADTVTQPALIGSVTGLTVISASAATDIESTNNATTVPAPSLTVKCLAVTCVVYLDTLTVQTTSANARVSVAANAQKVPDFTVFSVFGSGLGSNGAQSIFGASSTFTTPSNSSTSTLYRYWVIGAGGGGGGSNGASSAGGGGGAGGFSMGTFTGVQPLTAITITVSASGGTAGTTAGGTGGTGGTSSIGAPVSVSAIGGSGGVGSTTGAAAGGAGGTASGGTINVTGQAGSRAPSTSLGGQGASSIALGTGGFPGMPGGGGGFNGSGFGSGGGGAIATTAGGGAGGGGLVIIWQETQ